jgi:BolA protein
MNIEQSLKEKVQTALSPLHLEIVNESSSHHRNPDGETHFKMLIVSSQFEGKSLVERQRSVQALFNEERAGGLHALTMKTLTPQEWEKNKTPAFESPTCQGAHKPRSS